MSDASGGRAELDRLLAGHSARTRELAARAAREVEKRVAAGQHAAQAVTEAMEAVGMAKGVRDTVGTAVVQSLCVGAGIWPSVKALPVDDQASLRKTALSGMWDGSGMTLSQTLHGTTKAMHDDVVKAVQGHIDNKDTAWDSSRKIYDGYGFGGTIHQAKLPELPQDLQKLVDDARKVLSPADLAKLQADAKRLSAYADRLATGPLKAAYGQMARRLEKGLTDGLDNLVRTATEEKARYHADRILRTERARAWGQGFHKECMDDPDVVGWKCRTSSAHKVFDICDFHAQADLYGMGPGIYPKDRHPSYPFHPFCFCNLVKVYRGMAPDPVDQVEAGGKAALQAMTDSQRKRLLTLQGSKAFGQGGAWQGNLRQWSPPGGMGLSSGAQAVLEGVKQWQPDLKLTFEIPKTVQEAEKTIEKMGIQAKLEGMALSYAQVTAQTIHRLVVQLGLPKFDSIEFDPRESGGLFAMGGPKAYMKLGGSAATDGLWEKEKASANARAKATHDLWQALDEKGKALMPEPATRAFVSESIADTIVHEFGHHIHALAMGRDSLGSIKETEVIGYLEFIGETPLDRPINWSRRPAAGRSQKTKIRQHLSDYATTNVFETFAEAFNAKYSKGEALPKEWERVIQSAVDKAKQSAGSSP